MTPLLRQYVTNVFGYGEGDLAHSRLGVVAGMGLTPDGLPPFNSSARLLSRSPADSVDVDPDNVVGMALPKTGTITTASGVDLTSSDITEAADHWQGHELVMTDGGQQGQARRIAASGSGTLTLAQAFAADPDPGDGFSLMPQRATGQPWVGHDAGSFYYYGVRPVSQLGILGRCSAPVRVEFDDGGDPRTPAPNLSRSLHVQRVASGRFKLTWQYALRGQGGYPKDFRIYSDNGTGTIDYESPLTDPVTGLIAVPYRAPGAVYGFTTPGYAHGTMVKFAVVGRNVDDDEQLGGGTVSSLFKALGDPPSPPKKFETIHMVQVR